MHNKGNHLVNGVGGEPLSTMHNKGNHLGNGVGGEPSSQSQGTLEMRPMDTIILAMIKTKRITMF